MARFGSDKPDTRFEMELTDASEVVKEAPFTEIYSRRTVESGGQVKLINVKNRAIHNFYLHILHSFQPVLLCF